MGGCGRWERKTSERLNLGEGQRAIVDANIIQRALILALAIALCTDTKCKVVGCNTLPGCSCSAFQLTVDIHPQVCPIEGGCHMHPGISVNWIKRGGVDAIGIAIRDLIDAEEHFLRKG